MSILKWQLFWEKEKMLQKLLLWDGGNITLLTIINKAKAQVKE